MGTLKVTMGGNTLLTTTETAAPAVAYNGKTLLTAGAWSGDKTLLCAGQKMATNVTVGSHVLMCAGRTCSMVIGLSYTANSEEAVQIITTSGTYTIPSPYNRAQFFLVGGGGASHSLYGDYDGESGSRMSAGGGGGGYTAVSDELTVTSGTSYTVVIGPGGVSMVPTTLGYENQLHPTQGGTTSVKINSKTISAQGGWSTTKGASGTIPSASIGYYTNGGDGGSGGGGGGEVGTAYYSEEYPPNGGSNGADGGDATYRGGTGGIGQGTTTRCSFNNKLCAGGGGGSYVYESDGGGGRGGSGGGGNGYYWIIDGDGDRITHAAAAGTDGTGGGGGGNSITNGTKDGIQGGSGVVIVRLWEV